MANWPNGGIAGPLASAPCCRRLPHPHPIGMQVGLAAYRERTRTPNYVLLCQHAFAATTGDVLTTILPSHAQRGSENAYWPLRATSRARDAARARCFGASRDALRPRRCSPTRRPVWGPRRAEPPEAGGHGAPARRSTEDDPLDRLERGCWRTADPCREDPALHLEEDDLTSEAVVI